MRIRKKEYYENIMDFNKGNPTIIWKTLKEIIRNQSGDNRESENKH